MICHNANCAGPTDPARDDSLEALEESLALELDGRPIIDGIELDTLWSRAEGRCLFAHDFDAVARAGRVPSVAEAAERVAAYLRELVEPSWSGRRFVLFLELKGAVGANGERHSPREVAAHVACVLDALATVESAARHLSLQVVLTSLDPALIAAVTAHASWRGKRGGPDDPVEVGLGIDVNVIEGGRPDQIAELGVDLVEVHVDFTSPELYDALAAHGVDVCIWMFSATTATLDAIRRVGPRYVLTSEAPLIRRWLQR